MDVGLRIIDLLSAAGYSPAEVKQILTSIISGGIDFIFVVCNVIAALEAILGYELVTEKELSLLDRSISGLAPLTLDAGVVKAFAKGAVNSADTAGDALQLNHCMCFREGTMVKTGDGSKAINPPVKTIS